MNFAREQPIVEKDESGVDDGDLKDVSLVPEVTAPQQDNGKRKLRSSRKGEQIGIFCAVLAVMLLVIILALGTIVYEVERQQRAMSTADTQPLQQQQVPRNGAELAASSSFAGPRRKSENEAGKSPGVSGVAPPPLVPRSEWGGLPPRSVHPLAHPTPYVVFSQTDGPWCHDAHSCATKMRSIQSAHMLRGNLSDIAVNFYIGGDGTVFVGRGWDATNFHGGFVRYRNIGISFIGDYYFKPPSSAQLRAARDLLALGVALGKLAADYKLLAHYQIELPDSLFLGPGFRLLAAITRWPNRCFWDCSVPDNPAVARFT